MFKKILVSLVAICAVYSISVALYSVYKWDRLSERAWAEVQDWKIVELNPSQFALEANYTFSYQEKSYSGMTRLAKPYQLNLPAAEKAVAKRRKERSIVFFDPENPKASSLERGYPLKKCLYAVLSMGVCVYFFFFLKTNVSRGGHREN